ncbi:hypothetical protein F441_23050 [Phytophthora nicotianae CJ01A1]|uniref:Uncharacterized protein n=5 Tax=Phytophthora nicotianae TaxID=4792 RepID=V9DUS0_PHYNI|nr:hypothetical protein F443_22521 [Phytophthora nicotianae P1569]ETK70816.1 hypothetical protein L915_21854 [Phytophthora nicotianae]ETO58653.1 hypothetical protein F444_22965 [Phytophthora nicotianae P1976]ETO99537.1 hypothetical protein F441_23050 [Phytophthora nicotianae CJ01A1]ETP36790.1 hypothetical protein F442_15343 [Phytophthora nicotianae P10297]
MRGIGLKERVRNEYQMNPKTNVYLTNKVTVSEDEASPERCADTRE